MNNSYPHETRLIENIWIPLRDGTRLAARVWLPVNAEESPVPAVLEYLPYRKDDATAHDDALRHPYFAAHGYAAVRVDLRGTGDSDGLLRGEYLMQEQDDALVVLEWLEAQPWCTGDVGMIGYSWGGFNGLQIAARRPPQLKAVITHASTDDRYLDDCHYMGGCMLGSDMLKWSTSMLTYPIQPPDPRFVGEQWRQMWHYRLENAPELARDWISHQRRDEFWKHGSVAEDYSAIECPVFAVGGWADAYTNAVLRLLEHLDVPRLGVIGPWAHMMPHIGIPGPAIGFLQEAVRWWDRWLKGIENGIMDEPMLRYWMQEYVAPARYHAERPGNWASTPCWPTDSRETLSLALQADGSLGVSSAEEPSTLSIVGNQACGETAGVWCANGMGDEIAGDQGPDDARSLMFTTEEIDETLEVLGRPRASLRVRVDRPLALVAVRLEDVAPSGESLLVSWGQLNLTHRDSHEEPSVLEPGVEYDVAVDLRVCAHRFEPGHRIRVAISPTYWPHAWPSPEVVELSVSTGGSMLDLPVLTQPTAGLRESVELSFEPVHMPAPLSESPGDVTSRTREVTIDEATGAHVIIERQQLTRMMPDTGARYTQEGIDTYSITEGDPLSAYVKCERETSSESASLSWRVSVIAEMTCDARDFHIAETFSAHEGDTEIFARTRNHHISRDHV